VAPFLFPVGAPLRGLPGVTSGRQPAGVLEELES